MLNLVYFSQVTETTHRFAQKLRPAGDTLRIPVRGEWEYGEPAPYVLILPTYGDRHSTRHVPHQVVRFLNVEAYRRGCKGVIATGNRNFGADFARAGHIVAAKLNVPLLHVFELAGDPEDVGIVQTIVDRLAAEQAAVGTPALIAA